MKRITRRKFMEMITGGTIAIINIGKKSRGHKTTTSAKPPIFKSSDILFDKGGPIMEFPAGVFKVNGEMVTKLDGSHIRADTISVEKYSRQYNLQLECLPKVRFDILNGTFFASTVDITVGYLKCFYNVMTVSRATMISILGKRTKISLENKAHISCYVGWLQSFDINGTCEFKVFP